MLTVNGQIIRVLSIRTPLLKLRTRLGVKRDGVGAEERVQMRFIFAGDDDGIDVFIHERRGDVDLCIRMCDLRSDAACEGSAEEKRRMHPVQRIK